MGLLYFNQYSTDLLIKCITHFFTFVVQNLQVGFKDFNQPIQAIFIQRFANLHSYVLFKNKNICINEVNRYLKQFFFFENCEFENK